MARYIDAERFKLWLQENYVLYDGDRYFNDIDAQPTADVVEKKDLDKITEAHEEIGYEKGYRDGYAQANVEVVTCKDCVFLELLEDSEWYYAQCQWHGRLFPRFGNPDTRYYFCADCQRREDGEIH